MRLIHAQRIYSLPLLVSLLLTLAACKGGSAPATETPAPVPTSPRFAYVTNFDNNTVSTYTVDGNTGQLQLTGNVSAGANPNSVTAHPSGRYVYVVNRASNNVSAYAINAGSGDLAAIAGSPYPTSGTSPRFVAIDPLGRYAYVTNFGSGSIAIFSIDAATGVFTAVAGSPFATGTSVFFITVDPSGKFLYVANVNMALGSTISAFTINPGTGLLTAVAGSPFATGSNPLSLAIDPSGRFLYVATYGPLNYGSGGVSAYAIDATSGALTPITPFFRLSSLFSAGTGTNSVIVDPSGKYVYVANELSNDISMFTIDAGSGALTAMTGSPFPTTGTGPHSIAVDPSGKFAYVVNETSNDISVHPINATTGALMAAVGSPMPNGPGTGPRAIRIVQAP
jgi:6-phosphogluconolactonase